MIVAKFEESSLLGDFLTAGEENTPGKRPMPPSDGTNRLLIVFAAVFTLDGKRALARCRRRAWPEPVVA